MMGRIWAGVVAGLALVAIPRAVHGQGLDIRFYPDSTVHAYELAGERGLQGVLVQNVAVVNTSSRAVTLERATVAVAAGTEPVTTRHLSSADLDKAGKRGERLAKAGLLEAYAFQFRPDRLLPKDAKIAPTRQVEPGAVLLLGHVYLAFTGAPDRIVVRVEGKNADGRPLTGDASIPLETKPTATVYDFPLAGSWFIGAGPSLQDHHRWVVPEEFALDIARIGEGSKSFRGDGARRADYYAYGEPVLAAADGVVRSVETGATETDDVLKKPGETAEAYGERMNALQAQLLAQGTKGIAGNYVVLEHAGNEFSLYAHLQPGSVQVKAGDTVKRGQVIARLGTSGNSTEPHLHFQVTDGPEPLLSAGIPIQFRNVDLPWATGPRALQSGDLVVTR